ncbi:MAG: sugar phosphate isomerase/epimerase family protein [Chloroflexota bacterium]|nr:sugar phosphate isomerase/epimerase family protein [Chloroflexota bacterium]
MELAVSSWSLHRHLPMAVTRRDESGVKRSGGMEPAEEPIAVTDFPRIIQERYAINKVELCQMHVLSQEQEYLAEVKGALEEAGVSVVNMPIDVGNISLENPDWRAEDIAEIKSWIDVAEYFGSPFARVNSGHPRDIEHFDLQITIDSYKELAAYCASKGMTLLLENHGGLSADPQNIIRMVEGVASPAFKLCPDFGNFEEEVRYEGLEMMFPYTAMVHAKTYDFDEAGEQGRFDFGRCMEIMKASGYDGPLSIEFEGEGDEYEGIALTKALIGRYL